MKNNFILKLEPSVLLVRLNYFPYIFVKFSSFNQKNLNHIYIKKLLKNPNFFYKRHNFIMGSQLFYIYYHMLYDSHYLKVFSIRLL